MNILQLKSLAGFNVPTFYKAVIDKTSINETVKTISQKEWDDMESSHKGTIGGKEHILESDIKTKGYIITPVIIEQECQGDCNVETTEEQPVVPALDAVPVAEATNNTDIELEITKAMTAEIAIEEVTVAEAVDVANKHKTKIAKQTLKMSDAGARVMGGQTKEEAREHLKKMGHSDEAIKKMEESVETDVDAILDNWDSDEETNDGEWVEFAAESVEDIAVKLINEEHRYGVGEVVFFPKIDRFVKIVKHGPLMTNAMSRKTSPTYSVRPRGTSDEVMSNIPESALMIKALESVENSNAIIDKVSSLNHPHEAEAGVAVSSTEVEVKDSTGVDSQTALTTGHDNVDNKTDKDERTGVTKLEADKIVVPSKIHGDINDRISQLKQSIDLYDRKGYNDHSLKQKAIDCLEQIKKNLSSSDVEGLNHARVFYSTLMSPILDLLPSSLAPFLGTANNKRDVGVEADKMINQKSTEVKV